MNKGSQNEKPSENRTDLIRQHAYAIWLERGRPDGEDLDHWMQAERRIAAEAPQSLLEEGASVLGTDEPAGGSDR